MLLFVDDIFFVSPSKHLENIVVADKISKYNNTTKLLNSDIDCKYKDYNIHINEALKSEGMINEQ